MRDKKTWIRTAILVSILIFAIVRSWYGTRLDSMANDEPYHLVSGAYYVQTGDYRLNPEHPPLSKLWVGLWNEDNLKLRSFEPLKDKYEERKWLQEITYYDNDDRLAQKRSRYGMYSFHFILGLVIVLLMWKIFGFSWAVVSSVWLALDPTIGAHLPLVLTDLPLSYCLLITALTASLFSRNWNWKWLLAFGVAIGMTLAVKHSALPGLTAIILLVIFLALRPLRHNKIRLVLNRSGKLVVVALLALVTLWATYGFQNYSSKGGEDHFNRSLSRKIDDLSSPTWKGLIGFMEQTNIFPRAYIWGLADTVRAGVEGRGDDEHLFFGEVVKGRAPYLYFPARVITKIPLALLLVITIAMVVIIRELFKRGKGKDTRLSSQQWLTIGFVGIFILGHLFALASGRTSYGGIRHALPIVVGMGILAGGVVLLQNKNKLQLNWIIPTALLSLALLMTIGEKRIYEYHNEIVGGTENAYKHFADEGLSLGQRFYEIEAYFNQPEIDKTDDIFLWAWLMDEEWKASNLKLIEGVKDIREEEEVGVFEGYFLVNPSSLLEWPNWDPTNLIKLEQKKRIGNLLILHGRMEDSVHWADSMIWAVRKYVRETETPDWELVVRRLEQSTKIVTWHTTPYVALGNALLKLGKKEEALTAYQKGMDNLEEGDPYETAMINHMELVRNNEDVTKMDRLRPMDVE